MSQVLPNTLNINLGRRCIHIGTAQTLLSHDMECMAIKWEKRNRRE